MINDNAKYKRQEQAEIKKKVYEANREKLVQKKSMKQRKREI